MAKDRFKIVPAAYLFLEQNGKILMLRRFKTGYEDGNYSLVAGHLDGGETFRQNMIREAKEEANIELQEKDLEIVHAMHRMVVFNVDGVRERMDIFVKARKWKGEIKNMEPEKCDDLRWFGLDDLPENTIPFVRHALECIQKNIFYSEFGWG